MARCRAASQKSAMKTCSHSRLKSLPALRSVASKTRTFRRTRSGSCRLMTRAAHSKMSLSLWSMPMSKTFALVPAPNPQDHNRISPWVDEQIWGHRLWDGQTPWLLFLEFLSVAEACSRQDQLLDEKGVYY